MYEFWSIKKAKQKNKLIIIKIISILILNYVQYNNA